MVDTNVISETTRHQSWQSTEMLGKLNINFSTDSKSLLEMNISQDSNLRRKQIYFMLAQMPF